MNIAKYIMLMRFGILYLLLESKRSAVEEYKILKGLFPSMADGIMRKWNIKTPFSHKNKTVKIRRSFTNILGIAHSGIQACHIMDSRSTDFGNDGIV